MNAVGVLSLSLWAIGCVLFSGVAWGEACTDKLSLAAVNLGNSATIRQGVHDGLLNRTIVELVTDPIAARRELLQLRFGGGQIIQSTKLVNNATWAVIANWTFDEHNLADRFFANGPQPTGGYFLGWEFLGKDKVHNFRRSLLITQYYAQNGIPVVGIAELDLDNLRLLRPFVPSVELQEEIPESRKLFKKLEELHMPGKFEAFLMKNGVKQSDLHIYQRPALDRLKSFALVPGKDGYWSIVVANP